MNSKEIAFIILSAFFFLHIIRDYMQIKYGYNSWFTRFGHVWDKPQYEKHGMVVCFLLGSLFLLLAFHHAT